MLKKLKQNTFVVFDKLKTNKILNIYFITILLFSVLVCYPLVFYGVEGDDTLFHEANIIAKSISLFDFSGKILPNIGNDLGYGIGIFYPPFPHLLGGILLSILNNFNISVIFVMKILKLFIVMLSGISMYVLTKKIYNDNSRAIFASLLYMTSGYLFQDLFIRDALNECFVFIYIPVIFTGIYYLLNDNYKMFYLCFIVGFLGLIYSHLVLALWFILLFTVFLLFYLKQILIKSRIKSLFISCVIILIFSSTFYVPLIEHMIYGEYIIFNLENHVPGWFLDFRGFFVRPYCSTNGTCHLFVSICSVTIVFLLFSFIKLFLDKTNLAIRKFNSSILCFTIISILLFSIHSIWPFLPSILYNIQFPWRLAVFITFGICLFSVYGLDYFYKIFNTKYLWLINLIIILIIGNFSLENVSVGKKLDVFTTNPPVDTNFSGLGWQREYLPVSAKKHADYFDNRNQDIIISRGQAEVKLLKNKVPDLKFSVKGLSNNVKLELPRLYYLGYQFKDETGKLINYSCDKYGFVSVNVNREGIYVLKYVGTMGYKICLFLKILMISFIIFYLYRRRKYEKFC